MKIATTIDPHGSFPITLDAEDFDVAADALGLRGLARKVGETRLTATGEWTFLLGDAGYRMTVVA